jgi:hypothetical protein
MLDAKLADLGEQAGYGANGDCNTSPADTSTSMVANYGKVTLTTVVLSGSTTPLKAGAPVR